MNKLEQAYQFCENIATQHYENFPVASKLLTKKLRRPICVIYAFARSADDFADEGDLTPKQRLKLLIEYRQQIDQISPTHISPVQIKATTPIFIALEDVVKRFKLPIELFQQLLDAFIYDVNALTPNQSLVKPLFKLLFKPLFKNNHELFTYCNNSANPIGRLMLQLHNQSSLANNQLSDHVCSALQVINFLQDTQQDAKESQRIYIPLDSIKSLSIDLDKLVEDILSGNTYSKQQEQLIHQQIDFAEKLLIKGLPLISNLSGRFKLEISLIIHSGFKILEKLKQNKKFSHRPRLTLWDKLSILVSALLD